MWDNFQIINEGILFEPEQMNPYSSSYFYNFNHGVNLVELEGKNCLASWFSGPWEGHPLQAILVSRYRNRKWSSAVTLQNTYGAADFDPAFIRNKERIFLFYSNARWFEPKLQHQQKGFLGTYYKYSNDEGENWSEPRLLSERHACKGNGIVLENGMMFLPIYNRFQNSIGVFRSLNNGKNWELFETETVKVHLVEPCIVKMKSGNLTMLSRTNTEFFWYSESNDHGVHWSLPEPTAIPCGNAPASLIKSGEHTLVACNSGKSRTKLVVARLDSFNEKLKNSTFVTMVDQGSLKNIKQPIHPSGSDNAVTYPSMLDCGTYTTMMAWSRYMINDTVHKGSLHYCFAVIDVT